MSKARKLVLPLLAVVGLLLIVAYLAGLFSERLAPGLNAPRAVPTGDQVPVRAVTRTRIEAVPAGVQAKQASVISSRLLATIEAVHVRAGDTVRTGQLLVELDQRDLKSRLAQSEEQVRAAQARLQQARASRERIEGLYQRKLVAQADLDRARAEFNSLTAELASARQRVKEAQAALSYTRIESPIDGRVVDRLAEPGDTASPGQALLSIYNPGTLRIEARVREERALALEPQQTLRVSVPSLQISLNATLEELVPSADPGSRSFLVKARIDQDERLLPGLYAELEVPAGEETLLLIPQERVAQVGQLNLVWVSTPAGPERRFVRLGGEVDGQWIVVSGLQAGEALLPVMPSG
ncbi:efflux RND transporter periplasmic adaptor subunit [Motiliproteus sp. SC1-56]|uniref:efflux RND transporter periplasmic adaptor subunit n=1 Tax=Motiliproteus sp. SC1-56 TaxID=2799565 RepID=UPI001A8CCF6C|nr:efflux RND transporter periplasmic adaptor subunit [Motiliproteus sp. SC1-56]